MSQAKIKLKLKSKALAPVSACGSNTVVQHSTTKLKTELLSSRNNYTNTYCFAFVCAFALLSIEN